MLGYKGVVVFLTEIHLRLPNMHGYNYLCQGGYVTVGSSV